jgi:acetyl-CoA carboxylase biotin carboxyl carrier protein
MADSEPRSEEEDVFEVDRIRSLVELMQEFDLREIDLRQTDQRIRLCRGTEEPARNARPVMAPVPAPESADPAQAAAVPAPAQPPPDADHIVYLKSPMVGTFYARPNPNAEPYVRVGDYVDPETTVCIIEAMKVFNEIPAENRGRIVAMLVEDEEPVEFGKPLFKLDTSS